MRISSAVLCLIILAPTSALAQGRGAAGKADSAMKGSMADHVAGPWKEMNAFHMAMAATWHPAEKDSLAPLRAKVADLVKAAEAWSASKAPMMPHSCGTDAVRASVSRLEGDTKSLAAMVQAGAADAKLKDALKAIHDAFETVEKACSGPGEHK